MQWLLRIFFVSSILFASVFAEDSSPIIELNSRQKEVFNFLPSGWRSSGSSPNTIFIDRSFRKVTFWSVLFVDSPGSLVVDLQGRFPAQANIYGKLLSPNQSANTAASDSSGWFSIGQGGAITLPQDPNKISQINELQREIKSLNEAISTILDEMDDLRAKIAVSSGSRRVRLRGRLRAKQQELRDQRAVLLKKNQQLQAIKCRPITRSSDQALVADSNARVLTTSGSQATCDGWYNYFYSSDMDYGEYLTELKNGLGAMCNFGMIDPNCNLSASASPTGNAPSNCNLVPNKSPSCASVPSDPLSYSSMSDSFACSAYFDVLSYGTGFDYRMGSALLSTSFNVSTCSLSSRYLIKVEIDFPGTTWSSIWDTPYGPDNLSREIEENNLLYRDLMEFSSQLGSLSAVSVSFSTDF